ncbi:imidazole glycerol phosphate synthase subunit HisF [Desulfonispora thiosulfatigenes]|nr:imidazole glycerol phosphate synthase subunit HisF [Desulfonispora thiosulfatigenes]
MLTKRIIPCLDVKEGRVVKGTSFVELKDAGDPVELASLYDAEGADELVFLDISASFEGRKTMLEIVKKTAETITIPFTVGGGINSLEDIKNVLRAGADKVSLNTAAVKNPELIKEAAEKFGNQCIVVAIDAKYNAQKDMYEVYTHGGRNIADFDVIEWAKKVESLGAGEILLTSMDQDGHKEGYDLKLLDLVCSNVSIPVIASGGAGKKEDFYDAFTKTNTDACLAASIFHYQETTIKKIKEYLKNEGVMIRWE